MDKEFFEIDAEATRLLKSCVDYYTGYIYDEIRDYVREDVVACSEISETGNMNDFTTGDVALSIGRAICERLGVNI